ncbi:MAG: alkaline phosphatase [Gomphosphaeria aponina SAG 52.96 = DSM 107014]|uniref:Alkaline phosphatase n=1 Tax=Gomphosphaeria aponina SAG 52.96 = DSM 107014 TaxID=1521640 RepID=A0A941GWM1_9CHRO|nr:alkaline phosphatase [Gomphosphaeria aponina SAG 52.96 = DSM 107014]
MAQNVIIMIGDGMGWEMTRAAAIQQQINEGATGNTLGDYYVEGVGAGLNFQALEGYAIATTGGTYIDGSKENSALKGDTLTRETGVAVIREGFEPENLPAQFIDENGNFIRAEVVGFNLDENGNFIGVDKNGNPLVDADGNPIVEVGSEAPILGIFDAFFDERPVFAETEDGQFVQVGGIFNAYDPTRGPALPWLPHPELDYVKNLFPDSANTATTLYTAVKSYNAAIGVDIYEEDIENLGQKARDNGKSFGVVTSVPVTHATPAAAIAHVSHRDKYTESSRVENLEVALDENGVPLHEDHGDGSHEGEPVYVLDENGNPVVVEDDNILYQILNETQPEVVLGGGHPDGMGEERYVDFETLEQLRNGETVYTFTERGENAAQILAEVASEIDVNAGEKLFGLYGARGQGGNLPWLTADGDYSNTGLSSRLDAVRDLKQEGETDEEFIASEINANPTLAELTASALNVLGDDEDGFWLMVEGGDIDWAMHDNNMDNAIGALLSFDQAYEEVHQWIMENGGYEENLLILTADHDHYLTLNENFPELLRTIGAEGLTTAVDENGKPIIIIDEEGNPIKQDNTDPLASGHYWGSDPTLKYGWAHHTQIPVPVYYQGKGSEFLDESVGKGFELYGFDVPGLEGLIDQVHIAQAMFAALEAEEVETAPEVVIGTVEDDVFDAAFSDEKGFVGEEQTLFTGSGKDLVDVSQVGAGNRIDTGSGDDLVLAGTENRIILGEGDDILFAGSGAGGNLITTGAGSDQVWLIQDVNVLPESANIVSDFDAAEDAIGFANTDLSFVNKGELWNYEQVGSDVMISAYGQEIAQLFNTSVTDANFVIV